MPILIISNPADGTSQRVEIEDAQLRNLVGTRIGQTIDGSIAGLQGYKIKLTGGTDKDGIPMRPDVHGSAKSHIVLSGGVGYKPKSDGELKRKVVRGNTVSTETTFLNFSVTEAPKKKKKAEPEPEPVEAPAEEEATEE
ncbi:MAG: 30S ribosomal protein S6e [Candidatus Bathyarchaeota archaeon]|nr:30S ribosomal protein S6e [Candidatus Bathyarchaeota archaeon]